MQVGVVVFPGSNCDHDVYHVVRHVLGRGARYLWHQDRTLHGVDAVVLPGGFSYGDYLRAGALARVSPVMQAVARFAATGGPVLGICNGFQILCEAGLLPGALRRNRTGRFLCRDTHLRVEHAGAPFLSRFGAGEVVRMPIAHAEGLWTAAPEVLERLEEQGQIALRYCSNDGSMNDESNPNGSMGQVAGVLSARGNILGLMPHPERAAEAALGGQDGRRLFESLIDWVERA